MLKINELLQFFGLFYCIFNSFLLYCNLFIIFNTREYCLNKIKYWNDSSDLLLQHDTGNVSLEGCLTEEYYKIRELLYEQYAIV